MGKYGKPNHRRCFNFDDDGNPIKGGCRRGDDCNFIHPNEPEWADGLRPSIGPAAEKRLGRDSRDNLRSPVSPAKSRDSGWGGGYRHRRGRSRSRSKSRTRSPRSRRGQERRDSIASSAGVSNSSRRNTPSLPPRPQRLGSHSLDARDSQIAAAREPSTSSISTHPPLISQTPTTSQAVRIKQESPVGFQLNNPWTPVTIDMTGDDDAPSSTMPAVVPPSTPAAPAIPATSAPTGPRAWRKDSETASRPASTVNAPADPSNTLSTLAPAFKLPLPNLRPEPTPPPLPPGLPPSLPPPPAPPSEAPRYVTPEIVNTKRKSDNSNQSKLALWDERTKMLADAVEAREKLDVLEEECKSAQQVIQSRFFSGLAQDHRDRLSNELSTLHRQRDEARRALDDIKLKLVEKSDSWPVKPQAQSTQEAKEEEERKRSFEEVARFVKELHEYAAQMKEMLGDLVGMGVKAPPALPNAPFLNFGGTVAAREVVGSEKKKDEDHEEGEIDSEPMDVVVDAAAGESGSGDSVLPAHATTSRKRRRVGSDVEEGMVETEKSAEQDDTSKPSQQELETLLEKLVNLETIARTIENDMIAHDNDLREEVDASLQTRFEELELSLSESREEQEKRWVEEKEKVEEKLGETRTEIDKLGEEVQELSGALGEMLQRVIQVEEEAVSKRNERNESYARVLEIEQRMNAYAALQESNNAKIRTLEAALKAYTSRPPSPPASPTYTLGAGPTPSPAYILHALQDQLTDALRSAVTPLAEEVRTDVERIVQDKNKELYETTWTAIQKTMVIMQMIRERVFKGLGGEGVARAMNNLSLDAGGGIETVTATATADAPSQSAMYAGDAGSAPPVIP